MTAPNNRPTLLPMLLYVGFILLPTSLPAAGFLAEIWQRVPASAENVSIMPDGNPDAEFFTSAINYESHGITDYGTADFLNHPQFFNTSAMFDPTASFGDSFILLTGQIFLQAGANPFTVSHDDGLIVTLDGGIGTVLNIPGESAAVPSSLVITAPTSGWYSLTLQYGECCGPPAALTFMADPDPPADDITSSLALLGLAAGGLWTLRTRYWPNRI